MHTLKAVQTLRRIIGVSSIVAAIAGSNPQLDIMTAALDAPDISGTGSYNDPWLGGGDVEPGDRG